MFQKPSSNCMSSFMISDRFSFDFGENSILFGKAGNNTLNTILEINQMNFKNKLEIIIIAWRTNKQN